MSFPTDVLMRVFRAMRPVSPAGALGPVALVPIALALAAGVLVGPSPAHAQPVSLADTPLEVQLWPGGEPGATLFIVTGHIPESAQLPATVRLPLPANARVIWAGEILGGPVSDDPERQSTIVEVSGGHVLEMTAETTRTVQYEAIGAPLSTTAGMSKTVFDWVQTGAAAEVSFSVRIPATAEEVRLDPDAPGPPRTNERGERLYTLRPVMLAEGQEYTVTVAYGRAGSLGAEGGVPPVLTVLLAALAVALLALVAAVVVQRRRHG